MLPVIGNKLSYAPNLIIGEMINRTMKEKAKYKMMALTTTKSFLI